MKSLSVILSIILSFTITYNGYSQGFHTTSNKAFKIYKDGVTFMDFVDYQNAENSFRHALMLDDKFYEAYMMLGELLTKQRRFSEAAENFKKAVKIDSLFYKPVFFSLGNAEMMSGDYSNALVHYNVYLSQTDMSEKNKIIARKNARSCEFAINAIKNPVPFNPVNVGSSINTTDDEYWPSITADGQKLMFTRQNVQTGHGQSQEDFCISIFSDSTWQKAYNIGPPLNTPQNEGAQTISSNGNYMFFTACNRQNGKGSCDIYFSAYNDDHWSEPFNLGYPINTSYWESQPSINADGRMLFFSSSRPGGFGGKDLWYSVLNEKNDFTEPVNMGKTINTSGDEMSPFIHFDGKTLYFASDGREGMGGFDIYMTRMNSDSTWTEPQNLGYPINTYNDEMGLVVESGGNKAYFSSVRDKQFGKDIFWFWLYETARPDPVSYLKGKVCDKETGVSLKAEYELINLSSGTVTSKGTTDKFGNFLVCIPSGFNYGINVNKQGYLFYSENFMFEGKHPVAKPFVKKINLNPIKVGEKILLANVFYEFDSWLLKKESISELNNLASLISENKNFVVEIGGYTDSIGSAEYNMSLSEKRAQSVVNYLISKGISTDRLKFKGYGNAFPIGDNVTEEGRKLNRRTEAKIVERRK